MIERLKHLPSTFLGFVLIIIALIFGGLNRWEIAGTIITASLYLLAYKPKDDK